jgi:hypothetical protein
MIRSTCTRRFLGTLPASSGGRPSERSRGNARKEEKGEGAMHDLSRTGSTNQPINQPINQSISHQSINQAVHDLSSTGSARVRPSQFGVRLVRSSTNQSSINQSVSSATAGQVINQSVINQSVSQLGVRLVKSCAVRLSLAAPRIRRKRAHSVRSGAREILLPSTTVRSGAREILLPSTTVRSGAREILLPSTTVRSGAREILLPSTTALQHSNYYSTTTGVGPE